MQNKENFYDAYIHLGATWKIAIDALVEHAALKQLVKLCENRLEEIRAEAVALAEEDLDKLGRTSGQFTHENLTFSLDKKSVYEFVNKPQKYTMPKGVQYRQLFHEQEELKKQSKALTKEMKTINDNFPVQHPNIEPDSISTVLKFIDEPAN